MVARRAGFVLDENATQTIWRDLTEERCDLVFFFFFFITLKPRVELYKRL